MTDRHIAVLDAGSSSVRCVIVGDDGAVVREESLPVSASAPAPGLVEIDGQAIASAATTLLEETGASRCGAIGITTQRASTLLWSAADGVPVGPGLSWQDLRTVGTCLMLKTQGINVAPNASISKLAYLLDSTLEGRPRAAAAELLFGTPDTWLAWVLTGEHAVDPSEAGTTGMFSTAGWDWDDETIAALDIPRACLPRIVETSGVVGTWKDVPVCAMVGDQQASLAGQGCLLEGDAKVTIGTGAMVDVTGGSVAPAAGESWRTPDGTYPVVAWSAGGERRFGREAIVLSAGDSVAWASELGLLPSPSDADEVARSVPSTDGVVFVPALAGLGSPHYDFGARAAFVGMTRGSSAAHLVRAVLEGIAHCIADCISAAGVPGDRPVRADGAAARNRFLLEQVADLSGHAVERSAQTEATALGAALWAGVAIGIWRDAATAAALWPPAERVEPSGRSVSGDRERWTAAIEKSSGWLPELSALPL